MKLKKAVWVTLGSGLLVAAMSVGLMGCPEEDDDDFGKATIALPASEVIPA